MNKFSASNIVNTHLGFRELNPNVGGNVNWANINVSKDVWWIDIPVKKFKNNLHLILNDEGQRQFFWVSINNKEIHDPYSHFRKLREKYISIELSSREANKFIDVKSGGTGFDFNQFNIKKFEY
ncbi:hypothetical protein ACFL0B_07605 [Thermodesulfobacteriota bacterium]